MLMLIGASGEELKKMVLCRICLWNHKKIDCNKNIFTYYYNSQLISDILIQFSSIEIIPKTDHPNMICKNCMKTLETIYEFRTMIIESNKKLIQINSDKCGSLDLNSVENHATDLTCETNNGLKSEEIHMKNMNEEYETNEIIKVEKIPEYEVFKDQILTQSDSISETNDWLKSEEIHIKDINEESDTELFEMNENKVKTDNINIENQTIEIDKVGENCSITTEEAEIEKMPKVLKDQTLTPSNLAFKTYYWLRSAVKKRSIEIDKIENCSTTNKNVKVRKIFESEGSKSQIMTPPDLISETNDWLNTEEIHIKYINQELDTDLFETNGNKTNTHDLHIKNRTIEINKVGVNLSITNEETEIEEISEFGRSKHQTSPPEPELVSKTNDWLRSGEIHMKNVNEELGIERLETNANDAFNVQQQKIEEMEQEKRSKIYLLNHQILKPRKKKKDIKLKPYKCDECSRSFFQKISLLLHQNIHKDKKFECQTCEKVYYNPDELKLHIQTHSKKEFECEYCSKTFRYFGHFKRHQFMQSKMKKHQCKYYGDTFGPYSRLSVHGRERMRKKPFECEVCKDTFDYPSSLQQHQWTHHNYPLSCTICGKTFKQKYTLEKHQTVHSTEIPFKCEFCETIFKTKKLLLSHQKVHSDDRKFKCNYCGKKYFLNRTLKNHLKLHTAGALYKCEICDIFYTYQQSYTYHMKQHEDQKSTK